MTPTNFEQELNESEGIEVILACPKCHSRSVGHTIGGVYVKCYECESYSELESAITEGEKWNDEATRRGI